MKADAEIRLKDIMPDIDRAVDKAVFITSEQALKDCNLYCKRDSGALIDSSAVHSDTLRHSFATRCVEVGFDIKSLSEILGHSNVNITLNRYVHSSFELKAENMKKLSVFLDYSPSNL